MRIRTLVPVLVFAAAAALAPAASAQEAADGKDVVVTTDDGLKLAATWWDAPGENGPGAVLLHMYRSDRSAWSRLIPHLRTRGVDVLAIDLRGHGGSAKQGDADLAPRVIERDEKLFAEMHRDAAAAVRWLVKEGKCDAKRIALVGASVGCSVAIDAAARHPDEVAAVACLSPGARYLGLDSVAHAKTYPAKAPLLLLCHDSELEAGAKTVRDAVGGSSRAAYDLIVYDDAPPAGLEGSPMWAHGTRMFDHLPLVEQTVASFVAAKLGSAKDTAVLDGQVSDAVWAEPATAAEAHGCLAAAYRIGNRIVFGGSGSREKGVLLVAKWRDLGAPDAPWQLEMAALDVAKRRVAWRLAGPDDPEVRIVHAGTEGATYEGEWILGKGAARDDAAIEVKFGATATADVPPDPKSGAPEIPELRDLPSR